MARGRAVVLALVMALSQVLPAPFAVAPAWAQIAGDEAFWGMAQDSCAPIPKLETRTPLTLDPPLEWQGRHVDMYATIRADGRPEDIRLVRPSGSATLDAAALAQVRQAWRWFPLVCSSRGQNISLRVPTLGCMAQSYTGSTPLPPLTGRYSDDHVTLELVVGQDGGVAAATVDQSSGDAARDAAVLAHVKKNWRYYPLGKGCGSSRTRARILFPGRVTVCAPEPLRETQTSPEDVDLQDRPRSVDLSIAVRWDGTVATAEVTQSSGDAALDAAAVAHVQQAWRWRPFSCADAHGQGISVVTGMANVQFPYAVPDPLPPPG